MRVLAVDDDKMIQEMLKAVLAFIGCDEVVIASDGEIALDILQKDTQKFDCLFLDINMPNMDGIELCSRVRELPEYEATPIMMLTAMVGKSYMDRSYAAGANDYVTKPFDVLDLRTRFRAIQGHKISSDNAGMPN